MVSFNGVKVQLDKTKADTDGDGLPDNEEVEGGNCHHEYRSGHGERGDRPFVDHILRYVAVAGCPAKEERDETHEQNEHNPEQAQTAAAEIIPVDNCPSYAH